MKKMTKTAVMGLALVAAAPGLTSAQALGAARKAAQPVQISFWYGIGGALSDDVQQLVKEFNATHPNIHVTATYQGSYSGGGPEQQKLLAAIKAGNAPDIAQMEVHSMPVFAAAGRLLSLNDLMKNSAWDKPSDFNPGMLVSTEFQGKYYGVPFNRSVPVLYYNKTMFKAAGIANPPSTWSELAVDAKKLTHGTGTTKVYGFMPLIDWWPWEAAVWSGGGEIMSKDLTKATFANRAGEKVLNDWKRMIKQGVAKVQTGPQYWDDTTQAFAHGQTAMDIDSPGDAGEVAATVGNKFDWGTAMYPADKMRAVPPGGGDAVILASSPADHQKAAWTFIQWWTNAKQAAKWSELTGYIPTKKAALKSPGFQKYLKAHPQLQAAIDELKYQHASPASPNYLSVVQYVQQGLQATFDTNQSVSAAMKHVQEEVNAQLSNN